MGKNRRKRSARRKSTYWKGRVNDATIKCHDHIRSAERGVLIPVSPVDVAKATQPVKENLSAHEEFVRTWKGLKFQGVSVFHYTSMHYSKPGEKGYIRRYFSGNEYFYYREETGAVSLTYDSRHSAARAFELRMIRWVDHIDPVSRPG